MRAWRAAGLPIERIAVNLSADQFRRPDLPQRIAAVLARSGLPARHLELEVTESMVMRRPDSAVRMLFRLKDQGLSIALDDFGTGYSSLSYLKRFPIDCLKIDRSFVSGLPGNADDAAIVTAIIAMAKSLKVKLLAEGVETDSQRVFLCKHGCDRAQGFLFGKPLPAEQIERQLVPPPRRVMPHTAARRLLAPDRQSYLAHVLLPACPPNLPDLPPRELEPERQVDQHLPDADTG